MNQPAFDEYVGRFAEVVRDPDDPRAVYVVDYDPSSYAECPVGSYWSDVYAVPTRAARGFTDVCWNVPDGLELQAMRDYLDDDELADAVRKHFERKGFAVRECAYNDGSMWAHYVLAAPMDAGCLAGYEDELNAWLAGDVYTVTGWLFDGEEWREGHTFGGVYLTDYANRDEDVCTIGRDTMPYDAPMTVSA